MVGTKEEETPGARAVRAEGRALRLSSRIQDTIEGKAQDLTPPNPPPEKQVNPNADTTSFEAADAPLAHDVPHVPPPEGPVLDQPMPVEPAGVIQAAEPQGAFPSQSEQTPVGPEAAVHTAGPTFDAPPASSSDAASPPRVAARRSGGMGFLLLGALLILGAAGAAAWSTMGQGGGDLLSSVRRMVGYENTPKSPSPTPPANSLQSAAARPPSAPVATPPSAPVATTPAAPGSNQANSAPSASSLNQANPAAQTGPASQGSNAPPGPAKPPVAATAPAPVEARKPDSPGESRKAELPAVAVPTPPPVAPSVSDARVAELDRRLSDLDAKLSAMASSPAKPAAETMAALAAQTTRVSKIDDTLAGLDKRLASLEQQLATPKSDARAAQAPDVRTRDIDTGAARVVVAQGLLAAVQSGASFAQPLAALRALGAEEPTLARLSASADTGVPSMAALRENFAAARTKLHSAAKPTSGAGFGDTMMARLGSLVSIKPASERAGPSPEAVASRIDAALGRNDLAGALAEARALPPGDAVLVKDWTDRAAKRADAEADARALIAAGVAALAKPKS